MQNLESGMGGASEESYHHPQPHRLIWVLILLFLSSSATTHSRYQAAIFIIRNGTDWSESLLCSFYHHPQPHRLIWVLIMLFLSSSATTQTDLSPYYALFINNRNHTDWSESLLCSFMWPANIDEPCVSLILSCRCRFAPTYLERV